LNIEEIMKCTLKKTVSLFFVLWMCSLNAQLKLDGESKKLRTVMINFKEQNNYDSTMFYWEKLNVLLLKENKTEYDLLTKSDLFWLSNHFRKDLKTLEAALDLHTDFSEGIYAETSSGFWVVSKYLSSYMLRFENYNKALRFLYFYKNSKYYTKGSHNEVDFLIANVLIKKGEVDSALVLMNTFLKEATEFNFEEQGLISVYNQYGLICSNAGEFEKAIPYFRKAIFEIDSLKVRIALKSVLTGNIGFCYYKLGQYKKAYQMLEYDALECKRIGEIGSYFQAMLIMAKIDLIEKRNNSDFKKIDYLLNTNLFELKFSQKKDCFDILLEIYESQNSLKKSLSLLKRIKVNNDSLVSMNKRDYTNYIALNSKLLFVQAKNTMAIEVSKKEQEKMYLLNELKLKDRNNLYLVLILILIVLSSIITFRKSIREKKQSRRIRNQEMEIIDHKLKIEFEQRSLLEIKVKQRNNRINHQLLELESKKFAAEKIIDNLKNTTSLSNSELVSAKIFIQNELEVKSISDQVHSFIDDIGNDFVENIKREHNSLTDKEIRLCVMVSLKLSNKEIGISQSLTTATIKNNKNRLKKKLDLTGEQPLVEYLSQFI